MNDSSNNENSTALKNKPVQSKNTKTPTLKRQRTSLPIYRPTKDTALKRSNSTMENNKSSEEPTGDNQTFDSTAPKEAKNGESQTKNRSELQPTTIEQTEFIETIIDQKIAFINGTIKFCIILCAIIIFGISYNVTTNAVNLSNVQQFFGLKKQYTLMDHVYDYSNTYMSFINSILERIWKLFINHQRESS